MYNIHLLPAAYGDSILIEYGDITPNYILIDGGPYYNFDDWAAGLKRVAPNLKTIELLVCTHIDIDHIDGIVTLLKKETIPFTIEEVWFNGYSEIEAFSDVLGVLQGEYVSKLLDEKKLPHNKTFFEGKPVVVRDYAALPVIKLKGGMVITLLSPGEIALGKLHEQWDKQIKKYGQNPDFAKKLVEDKRYDDDDILGGLDMDILQQAKVVGDKTAPNGSSIAFIGTFNKKACLFAGDATSDYLLNAIEPMLKKSGAKKLKLSAWKLAHHGSKKSNLDSLMVKIDCKKILVSTNGTKFKHPDQICIAKLIKNNGPNLQFNFNYQSPFNEGWAEKGMQKLYKYKAIYPKDKTVPGITLKL